MTKAENDVEYDVVIVGGGIAGASCARHLAGAGFKVVLFDKGDFASGSTGRSSRILHWGIRFLAPTQSAMEHVRSPLAFLRSLKSSRKIYRDYLNYADTIGDYLNPIALTLPFRKDIKIYGWQIDIGSALIGGLAARARVAFKRYSGRSLPSGGPQFTNPKDIRNLVQFNDYQFMWPDRICIDAILDAARLGADVRNYTEVISLLSDGPAERPWRVRARAVQTGAEVEVRAKFVVNTGGVWVDDILRRTNPAMNARPGQKVAVTKGSHIMVKLPENYRNRGIVDRKSGGAALFVMPWGEFHYIGPTETAFDADKDVATPTSDEVEVILKEISSKLADISLKPSDVLFAWSGLRPRTYKEGLPGGIGTEAGILHDLEKEGIGNYLAVTWCTINQHRATGIEVTEFISKRLQPTRPKRAVSFTPRSKLSKRVIMEGKRIPAMAEIRTAVEDEYARSLRDVFIRRTPYGWGPYLRREDVIAASREMQAILGWSEEQRVDEVDAFTAYMKEFHMYDLPA